MTSFLARHVVLSSLDSTGTYRTLIRTILLRVAPGDVCLGVENTVDLAKYVGGSLTMSCSSCSANSLG